MSKLLLLLAIGAHVALMTSGSSRSKTSVTSFASSSSSESFESDSTSYQSSSVEIINSSGNSNNAKCDNIKKGDARCGYRQHEKYYKCPDNLCAPQYCYQVGYPRNCPEVKPGCCSKSPGCYCEEGYVRDETGKCIDARQCSTCGGDENSKPGCGINCGRLCSNYNSSKPQFCPALCKLDGCDCKDGYVYDENTGRCVTPDQCTATCTKPNTAFSSCANGVCYTAQTCKDLDTSNGTVICPNVDECKPGCICKDGYLLDDQGNCIPENECPNSKCKGADQTYFICPDTQCGPKYCSEVGIPELSNCQATENGECPGKPGCLCRNGFVYDSNGVCIPTSECPSCGPNGDKNATLGCGSNCGRRCSTYWKSNRIACPLICRINSCDCKEGFVIDDNTGFCVETQDCTKVCGQNEEYSYCANGGCWKARNCSEFKDEEEYNNLPLKCARPAKCIEDCICKDGYVRNQNGVCVLPKECKANKKCKGNHEFYEPCADPCLKQKCSEIGRYLNNCPAPPENATCKGACLCAAGYYRDNKGRCILEQECPKYCPPQCPTDEEYSDCMNGGCYGPRTCATRRDPTICVDLIQGGCKGGCICREGFLRNDEGKCVPQYKCPPITCPNKDEEWDDCINGGCKGPLTCDELSQRGNNTICIKLAEGTCQGGCKCKKDWVRNDKGVCVPQSKCPRATCKENEEFNLCPGKCPLKRCGFKDSLVLCPKQPVVGDKDCLPPTCTCKSGYYRNDKGKCVEWKQCSKCSVNEVFDNCSPGCPPRECGVNIAAVTCLPVSESPCRAECRCKDGYLRNYYGRCVAETECPPPLDQNICKINEVFVSCLNPCPLQECSVNPAVIKCAKPPQVGDPDCKPGCRCVDGYARNDSRICIPREECPNTTVKCTKPHEFFACGGACDNICSRLGQYNQSSCPFINIKCNPMCYCESGYARDGSGNCVPISECRSCPGKHEWNDTCARDCPPDTCSSFGKKYFCPLLVKPPNKNCKAACRCEDDYSRDANGTCIPRKDCPCGDGSDPNAVIGGGCGVPCDRYCTTYNSSEPIVCTEQCKNECDCKPGYVYDNIAKRCTLPEKCTPTSCPENEVVSTCIEGFCSQQECSKKDEPFPCPDVRPGGCTSGCLCKSGYLRDVNGTCIPEDQCPSNPCGKNARNSTCIQAECRALTCADRGKSLPCPRVKEGCCKVGCVCNEGYLKDKNGDCIPEGDCPCQNGGYWETCPAQPCAADNCPKSRNDPQVCRSTKNCGRPRCVCGFNKKLDSNGKCIPIADCPPFPCGDNEKYIACPSLCIKENCTNYLNNDTTCHIIGRIGIVLPCSPKCLCKKGYFRNSEGNCIKAKQCPNGCPSKDEVWDDCINGGCKGPLNCTELEQRGNTTICKKLVEGACKGGCKCKKDWVRNEKGVCVPQSQCPVKCNGANERWVPCPKPCDPNTCESIGKKLHCPRRTTRRRPCKGQCQCKSGYYRNKIGECIAKEDCLKCTKPHEYFSCGGACDNICSRLGQYNQSSCPFINVKCNPMCYCESGYARDGSGNCVPISKCRSCPGKHEWNDTCAANCPPDTCSSFGKVYHCPLLVKPPNKNCKAACRCEDDYSRDANGTCIPRKDCPCGDGSDPNAVIGGGCGVPCDRYCSTYNSSEPIVCTEQCKSECDCKPGYVYDNIAKRCTLPEKCTPKSCSGDGEEVSICVESLCRQQECSKKDEPVSCPDLVPGACSSGCVCKEGYLRDAKGNCVPEDQCPTNPCGKNARNSTCIQAECRALTCADRGKSLPCPRVKEGCCKVGCVCNEGYLKDKNGDCIPEGDCPCQNGGYWETCPTTQPCDADYCPKSRNDSQECTFTKNCGRPRCTCTFNEKLDRETGKCIPIKKCPPFPCGKNEKYNSCPVCVRENCTDYLKNDTTCHSIGKIGVVVRCSPKCLCKKGYFRDSEGNCIEAKQCAKGDNGTPGSDNTCNTGTPGDTTADQLKLKQGLNQFSIELFKTVAADKPDENLIFSPYSIALPFYQLMLNSKGATLTQMEKTLGVESNNQLRRAIRSVLNSMKGGGGVILDTAIRIYYNDIFNVTNQTKSDYSCLFNATIKPLNMKQPEASANEVNKYVAENTDNKITNLLSPDVFNDLVRLVLVNAIYLKGTWKMQFNKNLTQPMDFYSSDNTPSQVQMMYMKAKLNYTYVSELNAKAVILDYENPDFKYFLMLPDKKDGLSEMMSKLNATIMDKIMSSCRETQIKLWLPRYKVNFGFSLVKYLSSMGMTDIFSSRDAQLSGLLEPNEALWVSEGIHKACVEVDEEGTTAAAATAVVVTFKSSSVPRLIVEVRADHPYMTGVVAQGNFIFLGTYNGK